ncbi:hypothetical protein PG991_014897 [Apiospora marii]|uniref:Zn(2)-C6 fungal-type domain-containing protein n=1 Tax=Apiospora marii TaxID=335849 RepID=A0ABR1R4Y9_9PEZI
MAGSAYNISYAGTPAKITITHQAHEPQSTDVLPFGNVASLDATVSLFLCSTLLSTHPSDIAIGLWNPTNPQAPRYVKSWFCGSLSTTTEFMAVRNLRPAGIFLAEPVPIHTAPSKLFGASIKLKSSSKSQPMTTSGPKPREDEESRPAIGSSPGSSRSSLIAKTDSPQSGSPSNHSDRSSSPGRSEASSTHRASQKRTDRVKKKRASKPKVKTGCKKRHVKCDEGKPGCAKCESVGLVCEGYTLPKTPKQAVPPSRQLLPRVAPACLASKAAVLLCSTADIQPKLPMQLDLGFDATGDDGWYMTLFRERVANHLSPGKGSNFWIRSSFRDCLTMKAIRHSILGIGAYSRALIDLKADYPWIKTADRPWWPSSIQNRHHQAALDHHIKAISYLQQDISSNNVDDRMAMAANLLLIVFENMRGKLPCGRESGEWKPPEAFEPNEAYEELDEMAYIFSRHSIATVNVPFPHGKSAYHLLLNDDSPTSDDEENFPVTCLTEDTTPHSCMEARAIWDRILHSLAGFYAKALWINLHPEFCVDKDGLAWEQALYLARLQEFGLGLSTLVATERNVSMAGPLTFLTIHHLVATIFTSCCLDPSETAYDSFASEFDMLISHVRSYLGISTPFQVGFTNEVGILPLLAFVAAKCRVLPLRLSAIDLLMEHGWREGPWDGVSLARAMIGLMNIEGQQYSSAGRNVAGQQNQDQDQQYDPFADAARLPSADTRYAWTNMFWDYEAQEMTMEYTKLLPNIHGGLDKKMLTVSGK